ncbi:kinetochore-associated protein NSL1 homolog [Tachyglossus aculeatus]|uniref:kinetochore-associated protein NSL1 homolog n=1 Tax=Tachyglossus aculeatus TaxID=9261 RepID=UPI0018F3EE33|nr:kinetochore-associated protein NSL1 homolog [Tachyglossus aculeatus]
MAGMAEGRSAVSSEEGEGACGGDPRVRCSSKGAVSAVLDLCGPFVGRLAADLPQRLRDRALRDAHWNFVTAVKENVLINGQAWQETSDEELPEDFNIKILEDQLDEVIVETAMKRKQCPRKILEQVIKITKAQQEILNQYQPVVHPETIKPISSQAHLEELKRVGEVSKQVNEAMKALPALIERADGFSQVLTLQPVLELQRLHKEIFSGFNVKEPAKADILTQIETTPTESASREATDVGLKRRRLVTSPQRKRYAVQRKKINLNT